MNIFSNIAMTAVKGCLIVGMGLAYLQLTVFVLLAAGFLLALLAP